MDCPLCQSCGMPLHAPRMYGTDAGGAPIVDYCIYCYKDGGFTQQVTMEEMIRLCAGYIAGDPRLRIARMRTFYPHLKRWAKKEETESEYYKSINRVIDHVKVRLHEPADLKTLAGIACVSPYHFHRIFKNVIGESLTDYIARLRMEYVAEQLQGSALPLAELARRTGYSSEQALSRAFRAYFDLPPKTFRRMYFQETFRQELVPRICKVAAKTVITLRDGGGWQKLYMYALMNRLLSEGTESVEVIREGTFLPALAVRGRPEPGRHTDLSVLSEGLYAIFTHRGDPAGLKELYAAVHNYWLPASKYAPAASSPYVVYLNSAMSTPPDELLSELYLPVVEKTKK